MPTNTDSKRVTLRSIRSVAGLIARTAVERVRAARFDLWQWTGGASIMAGLYLTIGIGATLIIGGVAAIGVSALREGGRI